MKLPSRNECACSCHHDRDGMPSTQHIMPCCTGVPFTDWPNVETDRDAWKDWAKSGPKKEDS